MGGIFPFFFMSDNCWMTKPVNFTLLYVVYVLYNYNYSWVLFWETVKLLRNDLILSGLDTKIYSVWPKQSQVWDIPYHWDKIFWKVLPDALWIRKFFYFEWKILSLFFKKLFTCFSSLLLKLSNKPRLPYVGPNFISTHLEEDPRDN